MRRELDRDELHQLMQESNLVEVLDSVRGQSSADIQIGAKQLGAEVEKAANGELLTNLRETLDADKKVIGFLALMYEAENGTRIEEELSQLDKPAREITQ